jgi:signal transduction histidine kinase
MPAPRFEPVDVHETVAGVLRLYEPQIAAQGNIEVLTETAAGELVAEADAEQIRRALSNLVLNAIDAMKKGGTLRVRTARLQDSVRIEISDTGQGLTEEERVRLFTPYYTTKQHGTGLGLAIVQSVVSDHRGKITVESEPGKGAKFVLDLPVKQPEEGRA